MAWPVRSWGDDLSSSPGLVGEILPRAGRPVNRPQWIDAAQVAERIGPDRARRLLTQALQGDLDPGGDVPRATVPAGAGHLLVMASATSTAAGVKAASVSAPPTWANSG